MDRKTVRRYLAAAVELGLVRDGGEEQLSDEFMGSVVEVVWLHLADGHGETWRLLVANDASIDRVVTAVIVETNDEWPVADSSRQTTSGRSPSAANCPRPRWPGSATPIPPSSPPPPGPAAASPAEPPLR